MSSVPDVQFGVFCEKELVLPYDTTGVQSIDLYSQYYLLGTLWLLKWIRD